MARYHLSKKWEEFARYALYVTLIIILASIAGFLMYGCPKKQTTGVDAEGVEFHSEGNMIPGWAIGLIFIAFMAIIGFAIYYQYKFAMAHPKAAVGMAAIGAADNIFGGNRQ